MIENVLYTGQSDYQQQMVQLPPSDMVIDVLGIRIPAAMLESGTFWIFLGFCAIMVLGVAWLKYGRK